MPEQMQELIKSLDDTRDRSRQVHETHDAALKQFKEHHHETVRAMLTPEQHPEYEKLRAELEQRAKKTKKN
jgi:hypothetical protein